MVNRRFYLLGTIFLMALLMTAGCQTEKKPAPAPKSQSEAQSTAPTTLLEAAGKDSYTNGCVSCHKKEGDVDRSLPAYVKRIAGHPDVRESTVNTCYTCHDPQKDFDMYRRFTRGMHKTHWGSDTFYSKLKGQCYSCHTVETNGVAGIKNYPAAGYRNNVPGAAGGRTGTSSGNAPSGNAQTGQGTQTGKGTTTEKNQSAEQSQGQTPSPSGSANEGELPVPTP